ncbi:MAG: xanthine dehydrogenase family protein subunit M [Hyphomicrobiaceae bacterium]
MVAYDRPASLADALALRAARPVTILAGGTDVYPARTTRAAWGDLRHADVLDIGALDELKGIAATADGWRIGAGVTWSALLAADLPPVFDGLKRAARDVGGVQIQNRGTIAGNVCNASPAADGVPCLLALDAEVETASVRGSRRLPLSGFITGNRRTALTSDEIVTALIVPRAAGSGHFLKLGARRYLVISIVMASGVIEAGADGTIARARIAVGACSAVAQRLPALEAALAGKAATADLSAIVTAGHLASLAPIGDVRASADYRRAAALTLVRDLVREMGRPSTRHTSAGPSSSGPSSTGKAA